MRIPLMPMSRGICTKWECSKGASIKGREALEPVNRFRLAKLALLATASVATVVA